MKSEAIKETMDIVRTAQADIVETLAELIKTVSKEPRLKDQNRDEIVANATMALRAAEDCAMRCGKAIQASTTGVSPLGGPKTPGGVEKR